MRCTWPWYRTFADRRSPKLSQTRHSRCVACHATFRRCTSLPSPCPSDSEMRLCRQPIERLSKSEFPDMRHFLGISSLFRLLTTSWQLHWRSPEIHFFLGTGKSAHRATTTTQAGFV